MPGKSGGAMGVAVFELVHFAAQALQEFFHLVVSPDLGAWAKDAWLGEPRHFREFVELCLPNAQPIGHLARAVRGLSLRDRGHFPPVCVSDRTPNIHKKTPLGKWPQPSFFAFRTASNSTGPVNLDPMCCATYLLCPAPLPRLCRGTRTLDAA